MTDTGKMCFNLKQMALVCVSFCTVLICLASAADSDDQPIVKTSLGSIQGKLLKTSENNAVDNIYEFLGIPYAQPPVGKLRFKKPEPVEPWTGIYTADTWSDICVQSTLIWEQVNISAGGDRSEDCLYLNIWTPSLLTSEHKRNRAVMVFIHGGAYRAGSASQTLYNGATLSSMGDVVVVTINYRLGILGFLNMGTEEAPGNQGFWDQRLALMWIQEHIEHFGGDPNVVTIFGESAGSMSVGAHLLSPMSQGLFHHAIMESGSPINAAVLNSPKIAYSNAITYATEQDCYEQSDDLQKTIDCLRQIDISQVIQTEDDYHKNPRNTYTWPTYGDEFLPRREIGEVFDPNHPVDLLIGFNRNEGSMFLAMTLAQIQREKNETIEFTLSYAKQLAKSSLAQADENFSNRVIEFYFGSIPESTPPDTLKELASQILGDSVLSCPAVYFGEVLGEKIPVYFYQFSHRSSAAPFEEWIGVAHGDELPYIFQRTFFGKLNFTEEEMEFHGQIVDLWTTFAKTGKPQVPGVDKWPLYSEDHPVYVDLKLGDFRTDIGPRLRECNFWRCYSPKP